MSFFLNVYTNNRIDYVIFIHNIAGGGDRSGSVPGVFLCAHLEQKKLQILFFIGCTCVFCASLERLREKWRVMLLRPWHL